MTIDETELRLAWERAVGRSRPARRAFEAVVERHREPHRRYHGLRHVVWVVRHVTDLARHEPVADLDAVVVAACYHDVVYRPAPGDEAASADLARRELGELREPATGVAWSPERVERVAEMILATEHLADDDRDDPDGPDDPDDPGPDTAVLLDADLAVLGAPPNAYQAYVNGVRAEYSSVGPEAWRTGRRAVLEAFLARPAIYRTPDAVERWEARARANLAAELSGLT